MTTAQPGRSGRFLAALLAVVVLVVGMPAALFATSRERFGSRNPLSEIPLPWQWDFGVISDALASPVSDETLINLLLRICLVVAWAALAAIVISTVLEVVHLVRHQGLSMPPIRGLGWSQRIARFIAAGLLVLVPLMSPKASLASPAPTLSDQHAPSSLTQQAAPTNTAVLDIDAVADRNAETDAGQGVRPSRQSGVRQAPQIHVVQRGESVYSIAESIANGSSQQTTVIADAILDANLGTEMPNGQRFTNPAYIEVGWELIIPAHVLPAAPAVPPATPNESAVEQAADVDAEPGSTHLVQAGDTLAGIAEERLGNADQWPAVWEANAGNDMGDGRTFDDPNLIVPGWKLDIPDTTLSSAEVTTVDDITQSEARLPTVDPPQPPAETPIDAHNDTERADETTGDIWGPTTTTAATTATPPTFPGENSTTPATTPASAPPGATTSTTSTTSPAIPDSPAPGGDIGGEQTSPEAPSPVRIEHAAMLAAGVLALVGVRRRQRLRGAIPRSRVPEPAANVSATERRLRTVDSGERATRVDVTIRAAAHALIDTDVQIGLVIVGTDGGVDLLLTGGAHLPQPFSGLHNRWTLPASVPIELLSDDARKVGVPCVALVQVGVADDRDVLIDVEACGTLAVEAQPEQADAVVTALATGLATSPYAEVAHLVAVSVPEPALLGHRNAHHSPTVSEAFEIAATLVGTTVSNERSTFSLRSLRTGGEVWEPAVVLLASSDDADDTLQSAALPPPGHGLAVVASVQPEQCSDAPVRLVAHDAGWSLVGFGDEIPMTPVGITSDDLADIVDLLDDASSDLIVPDDIPQNEAPAGVVAADTAMIDEPVDDFTPRQHSVVVRLLGGVEVVDSEGNAGTFERSKTVELIAWLATHRERSTRTAARTALWELDVRDATFANVVSEARRALGRLVAPPSDEEWLARTLSEQLPLHEHVVTDAQLVAERLEEARLQPPLQAVKTLGPAAQMIRDMPFAGTSYLWPDAEGLTSSLVLLATSVTAELAAHALSLGDTDLVFWATGRGLTVLPGHEELIGLRMRAHANAGDLAGVRQEWESYERVIVADAWSDGEPAPKLLALRRELLISS